MDDVFRPPRQQATKKDDILRPSRQHSKIMLTNIKTKMKSANLKNTDAKKECVHK